MNFSIRGMETMEQTVGNRLFQLIIEINDRIIALRADADDKIPSREKVKAKKRRPLQRNHLLRRRSSLKFKPKTPKTKISKPATPKSKKLEDESISASEMLGRSLLTEGGILKMDLRVKNRWSDLLLHSLSRNLRHLKEIRYST
ncbi:MAG: hypothetical protein IPJ46_01105 [Anaerolineales bacterium]|nr:hypothetical protein [Anaerolineales bacterium]